jgi:hypothetical protein
LHGAIAQSFYDFAKSFFIDTLLSHFSLLVAQSFFIAALLSHFPLSKVILLQNGWAGQTGCSLICTEQVLSHFMILLSHFLLLHY